MRVGYPSIPPSVGDLERAIRRRWEDEGTFEQSLEARAGAEDFVFFEGPPTANGRPGVHHILARTIKDAIARYRTMAGRHVPRKAGWDTHGLPVELEVEKALGISGKPEIERLGIEAFNRACRENVFRYQDQWEQMSRDIGYWLDYDDAYVTYSSEYIESCWWALSEIDQAGLLYPGYRVVPTCPRCGTGLSSHEVAQGYRDVADPAVHVKFHLVDDPEGARILSWTTTPWTLPGNVALAVGPDIDYVRVRILSGGGPDATATNGRMLEPVRKHDGPGGAEPGEVLILARDRVREVLRHSYEIVGTVKGRDLVGARYAPLFPGAVEGGSSETVWTILAADFVTVEDGTGVVHTAVMYGEDDFRLGTEEGLPQQHTVGGDGCFLDHLPEGIAGQPVRASLTERRIRDWLVEHDNLYVREMYRHSYPHCWRCDSPLLYMARDSWYIRTTAVRERLLELNGTIDWHPPETGTGRMGEWLKNNVDWALSRERYWGTPLPIWVCSEIESHREVLGSYQELADRVGGLPTDFDPHRPGVDTYVWPCAEDGCEGRMHRVPEVADAWFDSGSMPFAQWHFPFENQDRFARNFPADYIAEGIDQTRGWFYSLLALGTILFDAAPFRAVVVNDQILDAKGRKMSKSRGNAVDPDDALARHGADVTRFYFLSSSNPWVPKRWDTSALQETERKLFSTLRHTYRLFSLYANAEEWDHRDWASANGTASGGACGARDELDRWVLSRLDAVVGRVGTALENFDLTAPARAIQDFLLDDLSNWYVRRSRDRFWATRSDAGRSTGDAFATLHECLLTISRLLAPFAPFISDWMHRALTDDESVHLAPFPVPQAYEDLALDQEMEDVRRIVALGRAARQDVGIRTRQPLRAVLAVIPGGRRLSPPLKGLLLEELNVQEVVELGNSRELVSLKAKAKFNVLGPKYGSRTPSIARAVNELDSKSLWTLREGCKIAINVEGDTIEFDSGDVELVEVAKTSFAMASADGYVAAVDPELDDDLRAEGYAREVVSRVQRLRRESGLKVVDRIRLGVSGPDEVEKAVAAHADYVSEETLAVALEVGDCPLQSIKEVEIAGHDVRVGLELVNSGAGT